MNELIATPGMQGQASVNVETQAKVTPLLAAASKGHTAIVRALLAAGANTMHTMCNGVTARQWAADNGHAEAQQCLENWERSGAFTHGLIHTYGWGYVESSPWSFRSHAAFPGQLQAQVVAAALSISAVLPQHVGAMLPMLGGALDVHKRQLSQEVYDGVFQASLDHARLVSPRAISAPVNVSSPSTSSPDCTTQETPQKAEPSVKSPVVRTYVPSSLADDYNIITPENKVRVTGWSPVNQVGLRDPVPFSEEDWCQEPGSPSITILGFLANQS